MSLELAKEKVEHGVQVLDEKVPGWWKVIDLDTLRMSDCHHCMLGQLFGYETERAIGAAVFGLSDKPPEAEHFIGKSGYWRGLRALGGLDGEEIGCCNIEGYTDEDEVTFNQLKCAWAEVIAERRAAEPDEETAK